MPDIPADALSPILADQIVARNIPAAAVRIIGIAAPTAVAGTTPIRTMPNATAPTMKFGNPELINVDAWTLALSCAPGG